MLKIFCFNDDSWWLFIGFSNQRSNTGYWYSVAKIVIKGNYNDNQIVKRNVKNRDWLWFWLGKFCDDYYNYFSNLEKRFDGKGG